jgi:hypothetical protein
MTGGASFGRMDVWLARSSRENRRTAAFQLLLIVAWHLTVFPTTLGAIDWLLCYGASTGGIADKPVAFDFGKTVAYFVDPMCVAIFLTMVLFEGILSWLVIRIVTRRSKPSIPSFVRSWWRICLWGIVAVPTVSIAFAVETRHYTAAMNAPLLWVACVIIGTTLLCKIDSRRRLGANHCQQCGYDLTGNTSGVCPECGEAIRAGAGDGQPRSGDRC